MNYFNQNNNNISRNARRRNRRRGNMNSVQPSRFTGLSPELTLTFRYVQLFTFTNLTTVAQNQVMRLNSVFDPDVSGAGTQPYLFDQMVDKYNRYRVLSTTWKVTFSSPSLSTHVLVVPTNADMTTAVVDAPTYTGATMLPYAHSTIVSGSGGISYSIDAAMSLHTLNGVSMAEYKSDDRFASTVSTSPIELMRLNVCTYNSNTATSTIFCEVQMEFRTLLFDPIVVAASLSHNKVKMLSRIKVMKEEEVERLLV